MDIFVWSTIFLGIWGLVSPFIGIRYGQELARRWQKEHWNTDNSKQEYRELLGALFDAANISVMNRSVGRETTKEEDDDEERSDQHLMGIIHTRLFINDFVTKENLMEKWNAAFRRYSQSHDIEELRDALKAMIDRVLEEATSLRT